MALALPTAVIYLILVLGIAIAGISAIFKLSVLWIGVYLLLLCIFYGYYFIRFKHKYLKIGFGIVTALSATAIGIHVFDAPSWEMASLQLSAKAPPATVYFDFDKLAIAVCILLFWDGTRKMKWKDRQVLPVFILGFVAISILGMILKNIAFDPKMVPLDFFVMWTFKNLILVSFPEELFFRGFIQREIGRWNPYGGWIIASLLFGLGHFAGGLSYVILAVLAGLMYGWLYLRTHNIFVSTLAHFLINALHLGFFTYPYLLAN